LIHLGSVPYANARPLLEGLDGEPNVRLLLEPPAPLAARLASGELDAALVPSVEWMRHPAWALVPTGAITSLGEVASVCLFLRGDRLAARPRILLDRSSRTSVALLRVLLRGPLERPDATFEECAPSVLPGEADADGVLLIGDPALTLDRSGLHVIDLGAAWTTWTGLPFVWAVWAARDAAAATEVAPLLRRARTRGEENLSAIVWREAGRLGLQERVMGRYLSRHIRYELGEAEHQGLDRFRNECETAGLLER
jgi:chorismate dehydratase